MDKVNIAEKEASEVLHSLLSVDRRLEKSDHDHNQVIVVTSDSFQTGHQHANNQHVTHLNALADASGTLHWHTPGMGLGHSIFAQTAEFSQMGDQQIIWQDHSTQINPNSTQLDSDEEINIITGIYPDASMSETKPLIMTKTKTGQPKSKKQFHHLEHEQQNKLEDNPAQVKARFKLGCECRDSCYRGLNADSVYRHRLNIAELTKSEHDMYLMGVTMACIADPHQTSRHKERRRLRASYVYQGRRVCLDAFLYLENVTHYQLKRIRTHVMTHGVAPRIHGNMGKKPYNTFSLDIYKHATEFLKQYLETQAGAKDTTKPIVVHGDSRKNIYDAYKEYGEILEPGVKLLGYSTFRHFVKEQFPNVKFSKSDNKKDYMKHDKSNKNKTKLLCDGQEILIEDADNGLIHELHDGSVITDLHQIIPIVVSDDNINLQNVSVSISQAQPQQTFIVTPVSHVLQTHNGQMVQAQEQTILHAGGWYGRQMNS